MEEHRAALWIVYYEELCRRTKGREERTSCESETSANGTCSAEFKLDFNGVSDEVGV